MINNQATTRPITITTFAMSVLLLRIFGLLIKLDEMKKTEKE